MKNIRFSYLGHHPMTPEENVVKTVAITTLKTFALGWGMVISYVVFNSFGALTFKTQVQKLGSWHFSNIQSVFSFFLTLFSSWGTWVGLTSITIATGAWILALAHLELSKAYPVAIGVNLLIVVGMSLLHFQEPLTFSKMLGTFFIFTGVIFLFR